MSLVKAIESGKEHRKPYKKAKAVSNSCCNHGGCLWCEGNRLNKDKAKKKLAQQEIKKFYK